MIEGAAKLLERERELGELSDAVRAPASAGGAAAGAVPGRCARRARLGGVHPRKPGGGGPPDVGGRGARRRPASSGERRRRGGWSGTPTFGEPLRPSAWCWQAWPSSAPRASESSSEAAEHLERALAGWGGLGEQEVDVTGPLYLLLVGLLATDARDVARAKTDAQTALELLTAHDIHLGRAFALGLLIEALIEDREVEAAEVALRTSGLGDEIPPGMAINDLLEARGLLRIAQGRTRQGLDDLLEFGRRDELWGGANPLASRWRVAELAADGRAIPRSLRPCS